MVVRRVACADASEASKGRERSEPVLRVKKNNEFV